MKLVNQYVNEAAEDSAAELSVSVPTQSPAPRLLCAEPQQSEMQLAGGMRLSKWRKTVGISKMTAFRWRKEGKLRVILRYGILWVTAETIQNFFTDDGTVPRHIPTRCDQRERSPRVRVPRFTNAQCRLSSVSTRHP
jgi:hypothetical protein